MLHHEYTNKNLTKVIFFHKKFKIIHDKTKKQNVYLFLPPYQSSMRIHGKFRPQKQIHCQLPSLIKLYGQTHQLQQNSINKIGLQ